VLASGPSRAPRRRRLARERATARRGLDEGVRAGALASRDSFRFALEIEIDGRGAVTAAFAKSSGRLDASFARCAEAGRARGAARAAPAEGAPHSRADRPASSHEGRRRV